MASGYYDITNKTLGRGHYGVVKLGRHCLTGEPIAMKIIEKSRLNNDSLHQLGSEIRILFRLSEYEHPNILKLYQTIDTEEKLFLVTEYCGPQACDLHDYLMKKHSRDGLKEREAQIFFVQICSAIAYCHSMGIVHRDLKPENILVTDYKHMHTDPIDGGGTGNTKQYPLLKLIDFGFANQWYPEEKMRTSCGTLAYSAPELLLGEPYDGPKVDVWGLGLMLYILLYGGNPFMQINDNETLTKILDCSFATPLKDNVDSDAVDLLRSLIKRHPEMRLSIDDIMRHPWISNVTSSFESKLRLIRSPDQSPSLGKQNLKVSGPVVSPTLPPISESDPLKNINAVSDDDQITRQDDTGEIINLSTYNRTRSLSITRMHSKPSQQQSLPQTRSSINLETHNQFSSPQINSSPPPGATIPGSRGPTMYRPTSPDVGGPIAMSEEERKLHDRVLHEMYGLTKLIVSQSSIEASLKNARFEHKLFTQNSIQPSQSKRKISTGLVKTLMMARSTPTSTISPSPSVIKSPPEASVPKNEPDSVGRGESKQANRVPSEAPSTSAINAKLSNDDYIYATYQLTRDKILRLDHEAECRRQLGDERTNHEKQHLTRGREANPASFGSTWCPQSSSSPAPITGCGGATSRQEPVSKQFDRTSSKENAGARSAHQSQAESAHENQPQRSRKLLQPQHKMRDKFTSFFRSGSKSTNGLLAGAGDPSSALIGQSDRGANPIGVGGESTLGSFAQQTNDLLQHEAFCDHNNETSGPTGRYFATKTGPSDSSLAYALPLARKCSLVSEESGCSNDLCDSQ